MVPDLGDPASLTTVLDVATTLTTRARIPTRRDRELTWYRLATDTNARLGTGVPPAVLLQTYKRLWVPGQLAPEFADTPALAVQALRVKALADPGEAVTDLTLAASELDAMPANDDPLGRNAALRSIATHLLQLNEDLLRDADPDVLERLGETLTSAADEGPDDVRTLAEAARAVLADDEAIVTPPRFDRQAAIILGATTGAVAGLTGRLDPQFRQRLSPAHLSQFVPRQRTRLTLSDTAFFHRLAMLDEAGAGAQAPLIPEQWLPKPREREERGAEPDLDHFNVGLATTVDPLVPLTSRSIRPDNDYLVWCSIGPADPDALTELTTTVDLSGLAAGETLDVTLFDAEGNSRSGSFVVSGERPLRVSAPADRIEVLDALGETRLYFRIRTPKRAGRVHLRLCLYHHNTLLRVHHLILYIQRDTARFDIRTPYVLAGSPTTGTVGRLAQRRLSMYTNTTGNGTHDLFFSAADGDHKTSSSAVLDSLEVQDLLETIRGGLRTAAWGSDMLPDPDTYKYPKNADGTFGMFSDLRDDLIELARSGYDAWDFIASRFVKSEQRSEFQELMRRPGGIIDIAPRNDSTFVPPMACLYDLDLDSDPYVELGFCPDAEAALRARTPLAASPCFGPDGCRHASLSVVCPSGFWGLRHDIGVPLSDPADEEAQPRLDVGGGIPLSALVGTVPKEVVPDVIDHADDVRRRLPGSVHVTARGPWFTEAAKPATYPIMYFLCHGEERKRGGPVLILDELQHAGISSANLSARKVEMPHHPLVVMNACDTAALEPDKAVSLVRGFTYHGAGAVIGTEIAIFPSLAYGFAGAFLDGILTNGTSLGTALRASRLELLRLGNPLGLAYILYGLPDAHLDAPRAA